jgi:hypothetical protein
MLTWLAVIYVTPSFLFTLFCVLYLTQTQGCCNTAVIAETAQITAAAAGGADVPKCRSDLSSLLLGTPVVGLRCRGLP